MQNPLRRDGVMKRGGRDVPAQRSGYREQDWGGEEWEV